MQSVQEDLDIAYGNGRKRDQWMEDREKEIVTIREAINRLWPLTGRGTEKEC
jgi:hypothetical protein